MSGYRRLAVGVAWLAVAFAMQMLFAIATVEGITIPTAVAYGLAFGASWALHRGTRGVLLLVLAFGLCSVLFVEGISHAYSERASAARRMGFFVALALPLVALVVRRWSVDADDAWFARYARRVVPGALVLSFASLSIGVVGAEKFDPRDYARAVDVLGCSAFHETWGPVADDEERLTRFLSVSSGVSTPIRDEVRRTCGRFPTSAGDRACSCARELLVSRRHEVRKRRDEFRAVALASALPFAIFALFAWRGRRNRRDS